MMQHSSNDTDPVERVSSPTVSAIVVSYYTGPLLARAIASLCAQPEIQEIMLVDNGNLPSDVEDARAAACGASMTVISGHGNIGFAAACNKGVDAASGDILLFFNPDAAMPSGGVAQLLKDIENLSGQWLLAPKLVNPDGAEQQGSRRAALTPWRAFVEMTKLYRIAPRHPYFKRFNLHENECPTEVIEAPTISGACFMLLRDDYLAIGGMDERYFLHVEDVDFCLRFRNAGGKIYFDPHVSVTHFKSSSRANPVRIEARKTASILRYFRTHFSDAYPPPFLWLVAAALWASFGVLFVRRAIAKALRILSARTRIGKRGIERARAMFARRSNR